MDKNSLSLLENCFIPFNSPVVYQTFEKNQHGANPKGFLCNICDIFISGYANLKIHYEGQQHSTNLEKLTNSKALDLAMKNNDGDFIILGFEYIVELVQSGKEKIIICELCGGQTDANNLVDHLKSTAHSVKYLHKHFPRTYKQVHNHFNDFPKVKCEFVQLICSLIKSAYPTRYDFMRPTVTKVDLYVRGETVTHNEHLEEDEDFTLMMMDNLQVVLKNLSEIKMPLKQEDSDGSSSMDVEIIEPIVPLVDLCEDIDSDEDFSNSQVSSQNFFSDFINEKIRSLRNCLEKPTEFTPIIKPLTDAEIEELMSKYESLVSEQQQNLLEILRFIQKSNPERFKKINSPF